MTDAETKFTTCEFRSEKEEKKDGCCGGPVYGWICNKRKLFGISPENCCFCNYYSKRSE